MKIKALAFSVSNCLDHTAPRLCAVVLATILSLAFTSLVVFANSPIDKPLEAPPSSLLRSVGENPLMDIRMRQHSLTYHGVTGTFEFTFDVRTVDGSCREIHSLQDSVVMNDPVKDSVYTVTAEFVFPEPDYEFNWQWNSGGNHLLDMNVRNRMWRRCLGGPDATTWTPIITVTAPFTTVPCMLGTITWWTGDMHYNVRAYTGTGSETIHNLEYDDLSFLLGPCDTHIYVPIVLRGAGTFANSSVARLVQ